MTEVVTLMWCNIEFETSEETSLIGAQLLIKTSQLLHKCFIINTIIVLIKESFEYLEEQKQLVPTTPQ